MPPQGKRQSSALKSFVPTSIAPGWSVVDVLAANHPDLGTYVQQCLFPEALSTCRVTTSRWWAISSRAGAVEGLPDLPIKACLPGARGAMRGTRACWLRAQEDLPLGIALRCRTGLPRVLARARRRREIACPSRISSPPGTIRVSHSDIALLKNVKVELHYNVVGRTFDEKVGSRFCVLWIVLPQAFCFLTCYCVRVSTLTV